MLHPESGTIIKKSTEGVKNLENQIKVLAQNTSFKLWLKERKKLKHNNLLQHNKKILISLAKKKRKKGKTSVKQKIISSS